MLGLVTLSLGHCAGEGAWEPVIGELEGIRRIRK